MEQEQLNQFYSICNEILTIPTKPGAMIDYAKAYAQAGLDLSDNEAIRVQCLYLQVNLSSWRGERAREVKSILKNFK